MKNFDVRAKDQEAHFSRINIIFFRSPAPDEMPFGGGMGPLANALPNGGSSSGGASTEIRPSRGRCFEVRTDYGAVYCSLQSWTAFRDVQAADLHWSRWYWFRVL